MNITFHQQFRTLRSQPDPAEDGGFGLQSSPDERKFYVWGEEMKRSIDWLIKVGARVSYHARRWYFHVASDFPLAYHYQAALAGGT